MHYIVIANVKAHNGHAIYSKHTHTQTHSYGIDSKHSHYLHRHGNFQIRLFTLLSKWNYSNWTYFLNDRDRGEPKDKLMYLFFGTFSINKLLINSVNLFHWRKCEPCVCYRIYPIELCCCFFSINSPPSLESKCQRRDAIPILLQTFIHRSTK